MYADQTNLFVHTLAPASRRMFEGKVHKWEDYGTERKNGLREATYGQP